MTPVDTTERGQKATLSFEFDLPHAPEKVWRTLTEPTLLAEWLLPVTGFAPEPGNAFTFQAPPQPGWDGTVRCRVLEVEEGRSIRYSWVVGDGALDTVVEFTLEPTPSGTLLSLVHSGFRADQAQNFGGARYGWKLMGGRLTDLLDRTP